MADKKTTSKTMDKFMVAITVSNKTKINPLVSVKNHFSPLKEVFHSFETASFNSYLQDTSIFPKKFLNLLKKELGSPNSFLKSSVSEQKLVFQNVQNLSQRGWDFETNNIKISEENISLIQKLFSQEMLEFNNIFRQHVFAAQTNKHKTQKHFSDKIKNFYLNYIILLKEQKPQFLTLFPSEICESELDQLINKINSTHLFICLIDICVEKVMDNLIKGLHIKFLGLSKEESVKKPCLFIIKADLFYCFQTRLISYLTNLLIEHFYQIQLLEMSDNDKVNINFYFNNLINNTQYELKKHFWYRNISDVSLLCLTFFASSGVVLSSCKISHKNILNRSKRKIVYELPDKIAELNSLSLPFLPRIIKPKTLINDEDILQITAPLKNGGFDLKFSSKALYALNISNGKKFKINNIYRQILLEMYNDSSGEWSELFKLPKQTSIATKLEYLKYVKELKRYNVELSEKNNFECFLGRFEKIKKERQLFLTFLTIAEILNKFPLFYSTKLDFRTRMYPFQYSISRTTGFYKHLLMDYVGVSLTQFGLLNLLRAYYCIDKSVTEKFENYLIETKIDKKNMLCLLKLFHEKNEPRIIDINTEIAYFISLKHHIDLIFFKGIKQPIHLHLELDQNASGLVFISLFLKNKALASECNLLVKKKQNVYSFIKSHIKNYLLGKEYSKKLIKKNNIDNSFETIIVKSIITEEVGFKVFEFFEHNIPTKYAVMCFCYNQKHRSRTENWITEWENVFSRKPDLDEYSILHFFSVNYDNFLDFLFPGMKFQLRIINKTILTILAKGYKPKIKTVDGCLLTWDYYKIVDNSRTFYNPLTKTRMSYRSREFEMNSKLNLKSNKNRHLTSFVAHLIHSIDAAVMREIIVLIAKKTGYSINHVHDCVLVHPNYVEIFYETVLEIYTSKKMHNLAKNLFFDVLKAEVDESTRTDIEQLEQKFFSVAIDFEVSKGIFDPKNMYSFKD